MKQWFVNAERHMRSMMSRNIFDSIVASTCVAVAVFVWVCVAVSWVVFVAAMIVVALVCMVPMMIVNAISKCTPKAIEGPMVTEASAT